MAKPRKKKVRTPSLRVLIDRYIRFWQDKFQLPGWPIFYAGVSGLKNCAGERVLATIVVSTDDNQVMIYYDTSVRPNERVVSRLVAHEMIHWVWDNVDMFVLDKLNEEDVKHYAHIQETAIETIAIALADARQETKCPEWWHKEGTVVDCDR